MKKFKKLIPALCMLLISAVLMGTSTYAWFSMNTTVTATGMKVTAKSESIYLLISNKAESTTAALIQAENDNKGFTSLTVTYTNASEYQLHPTALATNATKEGVKKTTINDYSAADSWYTADAVDASAANANTTTEKALTSLNGYVLKYTYKFTLAKGSNAAQDLKVTACTMTQDGDKTITAARALVVCGANVEEFNSTKTAGTVTLATELTDKTFVTVDVYLYIDGNDTSIYTNNVANLNAASIALTFGVVPKP